VHRLIAEFLFLFGDPGQGFFRESLRDKSCQPVADARWRIVLARAVDEGEGFRKEGIEVQTEPRRKSFRRGDAEGSCLERSARQSVAHSSRSLQRPSGYHVLSLIGACDPGRLGI
jgi:hypothetical protein